MTIYIFSFLPKANSMNVNGNFYTQEVYDEMIKQIQSKIDADKMFVQIDGSSYSNNIEDICGKVKSINPETNEVEVDIFLEEIDNPNILQNFSVGMISKGTLKPREHGSEILIDKFEVISCGLILPEKEPNDEKF